MPDHPAQAKYPYRVFVSYSHGDKEIAYRIRERIRAIGAIPMSDLNLDPGFYFYDEIKRHITYAHIFIPILTPSGSDEMRGQFHQGSTRGSPRRASLTARLGDQLRPRSSELQQTIRV